MKYVMCHKLYDNSYWARVTYGYVSSNKTTLFSGSDKYFDKIINLKCKAFNKIHNELLLRIKWPQISQRIDVITWINIVYFPSKQYNQWDSK